MDIPTIESYLHERHVPPPADLPCSTTDNPFWEIVRRFPGERFDWIHAQKWSPDDFATIRAHQPGRKALASRYSWAIPDPATLLFVTEWLSPAAIEIGAGTAYWAWQLRQLGVDILAYDSMPPDQCYENPWHSPYADNGTCLQTPRPVWHPVHTGSSEVLAAHPDRTLFLCWPPMSSLAVDCLRTYPGARLVYIGESDGGCTADEDFFALLETDWQEVAEHRPVQWWGIHDYVTVYERKGETHA